MYSVPNLLLIVYCDY